MNDEVKLEYIPIEELIRFPRNPKDHDLGALTRTISSSIGFVTPIIVDSTSGMIGAGHGRLDALFELYRQNPTKPPKRIKLDNAGRWLVPVNIVQFANEKELSAFNIADNQMTMLGGWNEVQLAQNLQALAELGDGSLKLTGFDGDDLDDMLKNLDRFALMGDDDVDVDVEPQIDKADELQKIWGTERGQIWRVGEAHRVMCGDSTDVDDVERLLKNQVIDATVTDPPYMTTDLEFDKIGVSYEFWKIAQRYTHRNGYFAMFAPLEMLAECAKDWSLRFTGCWVKYLPVNRIHTAKKPMRQFEMYSVFAHPKHKISELVWNTVYFEGEPYKKVMRNKGYKRGGKDQLDRANSSAWTLDGYIIENNGYREYTDTLFSASKPSMKHNERTIHPTQKPVEVISTIIRWLTNPDMLVYDPFLGSGTTLIASDRTKRVCYGMEINPAYVAVILQRAKDYCLECELLP